MSNSHPKDAEAHACRQLLAVLPLAPAALMSVSTLSLMLDTMSAGGLSLTVSYVPDRYLVSREGFAAYARARTAAMPWDTPLEALAALVADDLANELVPRWLRVTFTQEAQGTAPRHSVSVEDRQPGWDHPTLLRSVELAK